jgi:undecaprenyl diphosphate synthase
LNPDPTAAVVRMPRHVAIIMDGNGRWAVSRGKLRVAGHTRGVDAVRATLAACGERGIEYLTLFAFSSENWRRPADEVTTLMRLFMAALQREVDKLVELGVRMRWSATCRSTGTAPPDRRVGTPNEQNSGSTRRLC